MTQFGNILRGVALGDSWGEDNEFCGSIDALTNNGRSPMGPDLPKRLHVTDDTQMSLYLALALHAAQGTSMEVTKATIETAFLQYYHDPLNDSSRAPGGTVMGSLGKLNSGRKWYDATNPGSDGSGTVMRTSACAFLPEDIWVGVTAFAAAVTHGPATAIAAAILDVAILRKLLAGNIRFGELTAHALQLAAHPQRYGLLDVGQWLDGYEVPGGLESGFEALVKILRNALVYLPERRKDPWARNSDPSRKPIVSNGGWRGQYTLVIALLSIDMLADDPWMALRRSVTTEGDSDTIGAVTGALLGAGGVQWPDVTDRLEPEYQRWIAEAENYFTEAIILPS